MVHELILNEGKDYVLDNTINGKTLYGLLSSRAVIGAFTAGAVTLPIATYPVDDTTDFASAGSFVVAGNTVTYTGKTGTSFTGCTGGSGPVADNALVLGTAGFQATDSMAGGVSEIAGTGYTRQSAVVPAPTNGIFVLPNLTWNTGTATDWPVAVRSVVVATAASGGTAIWVATMATARDMSGQNANLVITPTIFLQNIGGGQ